MGVSRGELDDERGMRSQPLSSGWTIGLRRRLGGSCIVGFGLAMAMAIFDTRQRCFFSSESTLLLRLFMQPGSHGSKDARCPRRDSRWRGWIRAKLTC